MKVFSTFLFILFSLGLDCCLSLDNQRLLYPDFDLSMMRYGRSRPYFQRYYSFMNSSSPAQYQLNKALIKQIYDHDKTVPFIDGRTYKIPRIIHQIWIGGKPLPDKYKEWAETWKNLEGWQYVLWTDKEVRELHLYNSDLYNTAPNYGEKSDILRYELLYRFGGLYVDTDMKCVSPSFFEFAHKAYSFYAGVEPVECCPFSLGNAIMASAPLHPIMEKIVTGLPEHARMHQGQWTVEKTGPRFITKQICANWRLIANDGIVLPPTFFYPILGEERRITRLVCKHECAAIHFWDGSWTK